METTSNNVPKVPEVYEPALEKIRVIASEYFEDYLIVVTKRGPKGTERFRCFSTEDGAYGKASFILHELNHRWYQGNCK